MLLLLCALLAPPASADESRWALLVGIDDYIDPAISDLTGSVNDVVALRDALLEAADFPPHQVFLLTSDDPANEPTRGNILNRIRYIASRADSDDLVLLHFSLHAVLHAETGQGYLLTSRTDPNDVANDGLPIATVRELVEQMAAPKRFVVLDGCRNDPAAGGRGDAPNLMDDRFSRGLTIQPVAAPTAGAAFTQVIYACSPGERAYEWPGRGRGLFSVALEEGLRGAGESTGGDGEVTLEELGNYVRTRVPDLLAQVLPGRSQVPDVSAPPAAARGFRVSRAAPAGQRSASLQAPAPVAAARPVERPLPPPVTLPVSAPSLRNWQRRDPAPEIEGFTHVGNSAAGLPEYDLTLGPGVSMRFVLLPAGSFDMGSPNSDPHRSKDEAPVHRVEVPAFLMASSECTQRQWHTAMRDNPSKFTDSGWDAPVEMVAYQEIQQFTQRLGLSLPSEAQWEYAARGGDGAPRYGPLSAIAWHRENAGGETRPVGTRQPNAFGLHDMLGNVQEWCEDTWMPDHQGAPGDGSPRTDGDPGVRVRRGGGYSHDERLVRASFRGSVSQGYRSGTLGFRPVKLLP